MISVMKMIVVLIRGRERGSVSICRKKLSRKSRAIAFTMPIPGCPPRVILAAAGIQSPFPHPGTWGNAGVAHMGPVCLAKRRGVLRILTKAAEIKGSGFPLRRERRGWGCAPILTSPCRGKEDIQDAPAVYDAIALLKSPFSPSDPVESEKLDKALCPVSASGRRTSLRFFPFQAPFHSETPSVHCRNWPPTPYATIKLSFLCFGIVCHLPNPSQLDKRPVRPTASFQEVSGELQRLG